MHLTDTWETLGKRLAVIAAVTTALVCLLAHNTLLTASIRGTLALVATLLVVRFGRNALSWFPSHPPQRKPAAAGAGNAKEPPTPRRAGS